MAKKVIVYTTTTCPWCQTVKDFLKGKKVVFKEINVQKNPDKAQEMISKSKQMGVPVTDIDGTIIVGFDKVSMKKALAYPND